MTPPRGFIRGLRAVGVVGLAGFMLACGSKSSPPTDLPLCADTGIPELERTPLVVPRQARALDAVDVRTQLEAIPGLTVLDERQLEGARFFTLDFAQPTDHSQPEGEHFSQRLTLLHRAPEAPMVLETQGEALSAEPLVTEPTRLLGGNQLSVEHRFHGTSRPASGDWTRLTAEQAAADVHEVVEAFKPLYPGRWLSTGLFEGGTAALIHRSLYPDDVFATLPYALWHSTGLEDARPAQYLTRVGSDACRLRLQALQRSALERRGELLPLVDGLSGAGTHFSVLGEDKALEFAVVELPFRFWQRYGLGAWTCDNLPDPSAPAAQLFAFVNEVGALAAAFSDEGLQARAPLDYRFATQLGSPAYSEEPPLRPLLHYPGEHGVALLPPTGVEKPFDGQLMARVEAWMSSGATRILAVHGELDPWVASAFDANPCADSYRLIASGGVGVYGTLEALSEPARSFVFGKLTEWAGSPVTATSKPGAPESLDPERSRGH